MHCDALRCTAMHCDALRCTAMHCDALRCTAMHCDALRCTAMHCDALRCTAMHCDALRCTRGRDSFDFIWLKPPKAHLQPCLKLRSFWLRTANRFVARWGYQRTTGPGRGGT